MSSALSILYEKQATASSGMNPDPHTLHAIRERALNYRVSARELNRSLHYPAVPTLVARNSSCSGMPLLGYLIVILIKTLMVTHCTSTSAASVRDA